MAETLLCDEDKRLLLQIARGTIEQYAKKRERPPLPSSLSPAVGAKRGAFVTLHKKGILRGCIGNFVGEGSLASTVQNMAVAAGWEDPRFPPLEEKELKDVDIEISALTPLREIQDPKEIEVGKHGIYVTSGWRRGVLLPQVATENRWDRDTFLSHTCLKAGLPADEWKKGKLKIEVFSAEIFGEKERGGPTCS